MFLKFIITHTQSHESIFHMSSFHTTHGDVRDSNNWNVRFYLELQEKGEKKDSAFSSNTKAEANQSHSEKMIWSNIIKRILNATTVK